MMRRTLAMMVVVIGLAMASTAAADPRDSVDRGDRLDTDALRDDVSTNRLKAPSHPLVIAPTPEPANVTGKKKSSSKAGSGR